jgi:hypothetical protein
VEDDQPVEKPKRRHVRTTGLQRNRVRVARQNGKSTTGPPGWRDDQVILKRLDTLSRLTSMGWQNQNLYDQLQAWLYSQAQPGISWSTFRLDQRRLVILLQEFPQVTAEEIAASVKTTKAEAWRQALNPRTHPSVQAGALRVVTESDILLAKLAGILDERANVKVAVQIVNTPIAFAPGSEDVGMKALAVMRLLNSNLAGGDGQPRLTDGGKPGSDAPRGRTGGDEDE